MKFVLVWFLALVPAGILPAGSVLDDVAVEARVVAVAAGKPDLGHVRGTAFLVGPRGLLATAAHVVLDENRRPIENLFILRPTPPTTTVSRVRVVRDFGPVRDLALLQMNRKTEDPDLPFFEIGEGPRTGDEVFLAGFPLVFDKVYRWPLFRFGRISSVRYFLRESKVLVLDLTSAGGFSGAPVIRLSDGSVLAVQKGGATGNAQAGFSLATELNTKDLAPQGEENVSP